jgi:flagellin
MGFVIQSNIVALNAQRNLNISSGAMQKSLERLSSGYRINSAADDAAGLAISQQFSADIASYKVGAQNVSQATALLQVAGGAMDQIDNMLTRLKELATQASSANAGSNLDKINAEGNQLLLEIDRIANSTTYAGSKLIDGTFGVTDGGTGTFDAASGLSSASGMQASTTYTLTVATTGDGSGKVNMTVATTAGSQLINNVVKPSVGGTASVTFGGLGLTITMNDNFTSTLATGKTIIASAGAASDFQVGAKNTANDRIGVTLASLKAASLDAGLVADQLDTAAEAKAFLTIVDNAIGVLSQKQGTVGAAQNRLGYANANLSTTIQNYTAAQSTIRDVDMASEMTNFTKNQILVQAGTAMLAQANMAPQQVLSLFK